MFRSLGYNAESAYDLLDDEKYPINIPKNAGSGSLIADLILTWQDERIISLCQSGNTCIQEGLIYMIYNAKEKWISDKDNLKVDKTWIISASEEPFSKQVTSLAKELDVELIRIKDLLIQIKEDQFLSSCEDNDSK